MSNFFFLACRNYYELWIELSNDFFDFWFLISGINFSCYAFENQAKTKKFAQMIKRAEFQIVELSNYIIWHIDIEKKKRNLKKKSKKNSKTRIQNLNSSFESRMWLRKLRRIIELIIVFICITHTPQTKNQQILF